jgi:hypothetical protein
MGIPTSTSSERQSVDGKKLYNGILLPAEWPPRYGKLSGDPMPVPYLENPPSIIPIDTGRQLFVDDFLIEQSDLHRTFHQPEYHPANPILRPDKPWENGDPASAMVFSDGVWYDPQDQLFKMWYTGVEHIATCYAVSSDGIHWQKPALDVKSGTNIVLEAARDSVTVWLDLEEKEPQKRYKLFRAHSINKDWRIALHTSADGIHWSDVVAKSGPSWDRTTVFWNPFRQVWVYGVRGHEHSRGTNFRLRLYKEDADLLTAGQWQMSSDRLAEGEWEPGEPVVWVGADRLDEHHPNPEFSHVEPELYNLDAVAYESIMLGLFTIWQGPSNADCQRLGIHKRNQVFVGFSRDGFHWHRPDRKVFLPEGEAEDSWNRGNVQSAGGGCLIVGSQLYFYCSGRTYGEGVKPENSTGLAVLRRDGFASLDADREGGMLTTRPLRFQGSHLFVNVDAAQGELRAEIVDANGNPIPRFTREKCQVITGDSTLQQVSWQGVNDLSSIAGQVVKFRFYLENGKFYSFWISPDISGASHGYVAAGGPGFTGPTDTVGLATLTRKQ